MKTTCIIQIGQNHYTTYTRAIEQSITVDIRDYEIDPLIYGNRAYILIVLLCISVGDWKLWESIFLTGRHKI